MGARRRTKSHNKSGRNIFISIILLIFVIGCITYLFDIGFSKRSSDDPLFGNGKESESDVQTTVDTGEMTVTPVVTTTQIITSKVTDKPVVTESTTVTVVETTTAVTTTATAPKTTTEGGQKPLFEERSILEKTGDVSNKKYSWWYYPNNENKPSEIDPGIGRIIAPYHGVYLGDTNEKAIYLTFDEGYENGYTASILDTLKEHDVKAVFFITGYYLDKNPDLVDRMVNEGHIVGNHSMSHPNFPEIDNDKIYDELYGLDKKLYEKYGIRAYLFRPPAGEYSERTLKVADMLGYKTVFWSFAYDDWYTDKIRGAQYAYDKVMSHLHNGGVYLLHAVSKDNTEALDSIITDCMAKGYEFKLLH